MMTLEVMMTLFVLWAIAGFGIYEVRSTAFTRNDANRNTKIILVVAAVCTTASLIVRWLVY